MFQMFSSWYKENKADLSTLPKSQLLAGFILIYWPILPFLGVHNIFLSRIAPIKEFKLFDKDTY